MGRKDIKLLVRSVDWSDCQDAQADLCLHCTLKILYVLLFCLLTGHGSSIGSEFAWHASGPEFDPHVRHILSWRLGHESISTGILSLPLMLRLRITGSRVRIPLEARFFLNLNGTSLYRAFHVHPPIVSK